MEFRLTSPAFHDGYPIPRLYTCEGEDISPPLNFENPPAGVRSFALIVDDPDAPVGTWVHWVMFNIPANVAHLSEGISAIDATTDGTRQGLNDFRRIGYGRPCPPPGNAHRYFFKLYALDTMLNLKPKATKADVMAACKNHILGEAQLIGLYVRSR